jgi:DNA-binding NarL/FixJ family response regulator
VEVLKRLAAGESNRRIASELVVTLDTVKKQSVTSWTNSARRTERRRLLAHGNLG